MSTKSDGAFPKLKARRADNKGKGVKSVPTMTVPKVRVKNPNTGETINIPRKYVPKSLSAKDRKKQVKSIVEGTKRPKVKSFESKRSSHVVKFENKYGYKISNLSRVAKEIIAKPGIDQIMAKGRGAYKTGGSRPNQTPQSWALARLASVITGGKARAVDRDIWEKYKR